MIEEKLFKTDHHPIGPVYYKTADCAVFVFDLTNRESFQYIEEKYGEFLLYRNLSRDNPSFPIVLIGSHFKKYFYQPHDE